MSSGDPYKTPLPASTSARRRNAFSEASLELFRQFCRSSTLHGTYFWAEARTAVGKLLWVFVVVMGK